MQNILFSRSRSYFYPRSPCGERQVPFGYIGICWFISIHALLAESDDGKLTEYSTTEISIHALLAESDTPHFRRTYKKRISIHALLAESDTNHAANALGNGISIHALLAESDCGNQRQKSHHSYFYPRSPCGERRACSKYAKYGWVFLSTLSLRRATVRPPTKKQYIRISIHALLAESDPRLQAKTATPSISIHALLAESDVHPRRLSSARIIFLSTLSLRRAT